LECVSVREEIDSFDREMQKRGKDVAGPELFLLSHEFSLKLRQRRLINYPVLNWDLVSFPVAREQALLASKLGYFNTICMFVSGSSDNIY